MHNTVVDCGTPTLSDGVIAEPANNTMLDSFITFQCEEENINQMMAVCGNTGEWIPNPALLRIQCGNSNVTSNTGAL